jgi:hypothetical protein
MLTTSAQLKGAPFLSRDLFISSIKQTLKKCAMYSKQFLTTSHVITKIFSLIRKMTWLEGVKGVIAKENKIPWGLEVFEFLT